MMSALSVPRNTRKRGEWFWGEAKVSGPQPLSECDERLLRPRDAGARGEHVVAAALDALQRFEIHGPHDLRGDEPLPIAGGQRRFRALVEVARAAALEFDQPP